MQFRNLNSLTAFAIQHLTPAIAGILFLTVGGREASAEEWMEVASDGAMSVYIDPNTIQENPEEPDLQRVWVLFDYHLEQRWRGFQYRSARMFQEYDCAGSRYRFLQASQHSESMASGSVVGSSVTDVDDWRDVAPGTMGKGVFDHVCR